MLVYEVIARIIAYEEAQDVVSARFISTQSRIAGMTMKPIAGLFTTIP